MTTIAQQLTAAADRFLAAEPTIQVAELAQAPRTAASATELLDEAFNSTGIWTIAIRRNGRPHWQGRLALRALRRAGAEPMWAVPSAIHYTVRVDGDAPADFTLAEWLAKSDFSAELSELDRREAIANARNQARADEAAQHPANVAALRQIEREAQIIERLPTDQVDQWIIAHMGYTAESLAALGKATRRDRRREARRMMARA